MDIGIQVDIKQSENFLKIKETLTRIGIASKDEKTLYQSCHIYHHRSETNESIYYIVHFKELFYLKNKESTISEDDIIRRNTITMLLESWGLLKVIDVEESLECFDNLSTIKIVPFKYKKDWNLVQKYSLGKT